MLYGLYAFFIRFICVYMNFYCSLMNKICAYYLIMKYQLSTKSLRKLKKSLPVNGIEIIANKLNISPSTVSRALNNKLLKSQSAVVVCALELIKEEKLKVEALENQIESL